MHTGPILNPRDVHVAGRAVHHYTLCCCQQACTHARAEVCGRRQVVQTLLGRCELCDWSRTAPVGREQVSALCAGHHQPPVGVTGGGEPTHDRREARVIEGLQEAGLGLQDGPLVRAAHLRSHPQEVKTTALNCLQVGVHHHHKHDCIRVLSLLQLRSAGHGGFQERAVWSSEQRGSTQRNLASAQRAQD